jgi:hypothetical protein
VPLKISLKNINFGYKGGNVNKSKEEALLHKEVMVIHDLHENIFCVNADDG